MTSKGTALFGADGTKAGTRMVKLISPFLDRHAISSMVCCKGLLLFSADDASRGAELWRSDGSAAGTVMVKAIAPGPANGMSIEPIVSASRGIYFKEGDGSTGSELWFSDGTAVGTRQVYDLYLGPESRDPSFLTISGGRLFFVATTRTHGRELHSIAETPATVETIGIGCRSSDPVLGSTNPVIGRSVTIFGHDAPARGPRILLAGVPSPPQRLPGVVAAHCAVRMNLGLPLIFLPLPPGSSWSTAIPIPNSSTLIGHMVRLQAAFEPSPLSNGLQLRLGR